MNVRVLVAGFGAGVAMFALAIPVSAAGVGGNGTGSGHTAPGDSNHGDVWVDTTGVPPGPGHEMDPHLPCGTINVYGAFDADASGTYSIFAWPPTGDHTLVLTNPWSYSGRSHTTQLIGSFSVTTSGHYYLTQTQDPVKHKTFWVECGTSSGGGPGSPPPGGTTNGGGGGQGGTTNGGGGGQGASTASSSDASSTGTSPGLPDTGTTPQGDRTAGLPVAAILLLLALAGPLLGYRRRSAGTTR